MGWNNHSFSFLQFYSFTFLSYSFFVFLEWSPVGPLIYLGEGVHDRSIGRLEINGKVESTEMYSCKKWGYMKH